MKGQAEIIGLLVIVIMLVVIAVFSLKFFISEDSGGIDDVRISSKANNLLNSMMKLDSKGVNVEEFILKCDNLRDCNDLNKSLNEIANLYFKNYGYEFRFYREENEFFKTGSCSRVGISATPYKFDKNNIDYTVKFKVC